MIDWKFSLTSGISVFELIKYRRAEGGGEERELMEGEIGIGGEKSYGQSRELERERERIQFALSHKQYTENLLKKSNCLCLRELLLPDAKEPGFPPLVSV